jgi:preprotein translocase subunit YajC
MLNKSKLFGVSVLLSSVYSFGTATIALAQAPGGVAPGAPPQPGFSSMLVPFAAMFAVVYFLMIRPQQKKMKEQQDLLGGLKDGDEILTTSGILGKVTGITEKVVTVEIANNVRIKMMKTQVSQVIKGNINDLKTI